MTAHRSRPKGVTLLLLLACLFAAPFGAAEGALPKKGTVAVIIHEGAESLDGAGQSLGTAEARVMEILLQQGYSVVNPKKMEELRRSKAARLALDGDVEAILRLGSQYGVAFFVSGRAKLPQPRQNEFGLFTATADVAVEAYSTATGRYVFSGRTSGKQVGYSAGEALEKALMEAAQSMAAQLTGGGAADDGAAPAAGAASSGVRLTVRNVTSFSQLNEILETCRHLAGVSTAKATGYSGGTGVIELDYRGALQDLAASLAKRQTNLVISSVGRGEILAALK